MSKEVEAWEEVKAYVEYCLDLRKSCNAMLWTSTYDYLEPFIDKVDKQLKALEIIKNKKVCVAWLRNGLSTYNSTAALYNLPRLNEEEYDLLKEALL